MGAAFRSRGIPVGRVLSSHWCRCLETARLAFGRAEPWEPLDSVFEERAREPERTRAVRGLAGERPATGNLVLVTHGANILALTGVNPAPGEFSRWSPRRADGLGSRAAWPARSGSHGSPTVGRRGLLRGLAVAAALGTAGRPTWLWAEESGQEAWPGPRSRRGASEGGSDLPLHAGRASELALRPRRREGLPLKDMTADARAAAHALLQAGLSAAGYAKARDVMRLEGVLRQLETFGGFTRDPDNYAVTIFGTPGRARPGGGGSRATISLNFTVVPGGPSRSPLRSGANPAEVRRGRDCAPSRPSRISAWPSPGASIRRSACARRSRPSRSVTS